MTTPVRKMRTTVKTSTATQNRPGLAARIDFTVQSGRLRPELHSSGWSPRLHPRVMQNDDETIRALNLRFARTHDWALVASGQRIVDTHFIFPLAHLDPKDPKNYYFDATDEALRLARNIGLEIFYRLGTSIEHTDGVHFNALIPKDFDAYAEVLAGIVRHYNKGWANGHKWGIKYWEIWNEPDGTSNMWCLPGVDGREWNTEIWGKMRDLFISFFVKVLKRLKSEFPDIQVGGPALCWLNKEYFTRLLNACKEADMAPDFISWHYYGSNPDDMVRSAYEARALCDSLGFKKTRLVLNEWHYLLSWDFIRGPNSSPAMVSRALDGPTGHNAIDSACFNLAALTKFQTSRLDQAYYYGCAHQGNWGYMDERNEFNKSYYAIKLFGAVVRDYTALCRSESFKGTVSALAVKSADGRRRAILLADYRGTEQILAVDVRGAEKARHVSVVVLDHTRDLLPAEVDWRDGTLTLVKSDKHSAAFLVTFED